MKWQFFHQPESNHHDPRTNACSAYEWELPADMTLADALTHARANGLPKGSRRCGCIEIQTDAGIYTRAGGGRLDHDAIRLGKVLFKTWEELDAE